MFVTSYIYILIKIVYAHKIFSLTRIAFSLFDVNILHSVFLFFGFFTLCHIFQWCCVSRWSISFSSSWTYCCWRLFTILSIMQIIFFQYENKPPFVFDHLLLSEIILLMIIWFSIEISLNKYYCWKSIILHTSVVSIQNWKSRLFYVKSSISSYLVNVHFCII